MSHEEIDIASFFFFLHTELWASKGTLVLAIQIRNFLYSAAFSHHFLTASQHELYPADMVAISNGRIDLFILSWIFAGM